VDKKLSLLLVDDEPLILRGLEMTFDWDSYGYYISGIARDGLIALERIKEKVPDVVLTDICMKKMDGISLIKQCSIEYPSIKFVIISAHQEFSYAKSACELGVYSYLLKPITESNLSSTMKNLYSETMDIINHKQNHSYPLENDWSDQSENYYEKMSLALNYISKNLSDPQLSMAQVSEELQYNCNYFGRLFKSHTGLSFRDHVNSLRLNRAAQLMENHDMSIIDIAFIVGYSSPSYFSFQFKKKFDLTPRDYRRIHKS
jgi:two-component system response regulator YesN